MKVKNFVIALCILLTAGCGTSDYKPMAGNEFGYSDRRVKENIYEVSFKGHKRTSPEEANDFAHIRALEIGASLGYEFMLVTSTKDTTSTRKRTFDGMTYRSTYPGIRLRVQYFERKPKGRYLTENLFKIDRSYPALRSKYGLTFSY